MAIAGLWDVRAGSCQLAERLLGDPRFRRPHPNSEILAARPLSGALRWRAQLLRVISTNGGVRAWSDAGCLHSERAGAGHNRWTPQRPRQAKRGGPLAAPSLPRPLPLSGLRLVRSGCSPMQARAPACATASSIARQPGPAEPRGQRNQRLPRAPPPEVGLIGNQWPKPSSPGRPWEGAPPFLTGARSTFASPSSRTARSSSASTSLASM